MMSATTVPTMPTARTASQYTAGMYRRTENCRTKATTNRPKSITRAHEMGSHGSPSPRLISQSDADSPVPVVRTLMIQNDSVTSGTLLSPLRPAEAGVPSAVGLGYG